ncbi:MAG TPA: hypothetical protein VMR75_01250 [Candidatus Saccharimonadales bacterium]|nr:hypothetical protein [Candidatus Saccharimonadales bacterium]
MSVRPGVCEYQPMLRSLHARWPFRRTHTRHDIHWLWLAQMRKSKKRCNDDGRGHSMNMLPYTTRRP